MLGEGSREMMRVRRQGKTGVTSWSWKHFLSSWAMGGRRFVDRSADHVRERSEQSAGKRPSRGSSKDVVA